MRRWAAVTALLATRYGFAYLSNEQPPTGGHLIAGVVVLGSAIYLLGMIAGLSRQRSRGTAVRLLIAQAMTTAAASGALLMQQLSLPPKLGILAFGIPLLASSLHFRLQNWTPKPITLRRLITDLIVEVVFLFGGVAFLVWSYSPGWILWIVSGSVNIAYSMIALGKNRHLARASPHQRSA